MTGLDGLGASTGVRVKLSMCRYDVMMVYHVPPTNGSQVPPTNGDQVPPTNGPQVPPTNGPRPKSHLLMVPKSHLLTVGCCGIGKFRYIDIEKKFENTDYIENMQIKLNYESVD